MPPEVPLPPDTAIKHTPCIACGADLRYAPGQDHLVCDHCGYSQPIPAAPAQRRAALAEIPLPTAGNMAAIDSVETETPRTLKCPNCAASFALSGAFHAMECPFCATPVVLDTGVERHIKPQALVPFVLTEAEARAALERWLGRLWFAPSRLQDFARRGRKMTGVYAPYWTFDARSRSRYTGLRGDAYYESEQVRVQVQGRSETRRRQVRKIRWHSVSGQVARDFNDVLIYAAQSLPPAHVQALQPWDLSALVPYAPDYLAGFEAEAYTVALPEGHRMGRATMERVIETDVRRAIGGDEQQVRSIDTAYSDETFKHILLPIWTAAYRYRGSAYPFVVNAQTGQVRGARPWSVWKIAAAVLVVAAVVAGLLWLGNSQQI